MHVKDTLINPRRACAARVTVVVVCVCRLVANSLLIKGSVRLENAVTYSTGNEGQKICGVFSETAPLQRYGTCSLYRYPCSRPFLLRGKRACAYLTTPVRSSLRRREQQYKANLCTQVKVINTTPSYKAKLDCLTTALCKNADFLRNELFLAMHDQRFIWHIS